MKFDSRLQFLKDGIRYYEIGNQWKGPCGHNIDEADKQYEKCEYCTEVVELIWHLDWQPEYNYGQSVGGQ